MTTIVLPLTELTVPPTPPRPLDGWHWPFAEGLINTDRAVTVPPLCGPLPRAGRTATQLPAVTSVSCAGESSEIFVDGENATAAAPLGWVRWIVVPDTDAISPATRSLPLADGAPDVDGAVDVDPFARVDVVGELGELVVDEPHAANDSTVIPTTARSGYFDIAVVSIIDGSF